MEHTHSSLADNLKRLIESKSLNITKTAQELNLPIMTVRRLLSGETPNPRLSTLNIVASYFEISISELVNGSRTSAESVSGGGKVPVLSWDEVAALGDVSELRKQTWQHWQAVPGTDSFKDAFALETRPSFHSHFPRGSLIIIDPHFDVHDGDIVLVKLLDNNQLTLRQMYIDPPEKNLNSLTNGHSSIIFDTEKHQIIGVNVLTMIYNKHCSH